MELLLLLLPLFVLVLLLLLLGLVAIAFAVLPSPDYNLFKNVKYATSSSDTLLSKLTLNLYTDLGSSLIDSFS